MPINSLKGLKGLKGISGISRQEYEDFVSRNRDKIAAHKNSITYINNLYKNKEFIDKYGIDTFKALPNSRLRDAYADQQVINAEWEKWASPFVGTKRDNTKGLGVDYEKYTNGLSLEGKRKVLESAYLNPLEFETQWKKRIETEKAEQKAFNNSGAGAFMPSYVSLGRERIKASSKDNITNLLDALGIGEGTKEYEVAKNQRVLENIFNDDLKNTTRKLDSEVDQVYHNDPEIAGLNDKEVERRFIQAYTRSNNNLGIPTYAAYHRHGIRESEMKNFSVDNMRRVLAKKKVYDKYLGPYYASLALDNEAKEYVSDNQSWLTKQGLLTKDILISSLSYSADKFNGLYNLYLGAVDALSDKPTVWVNDKNEVIDLKSIDPKNIRVRQDAPKQIVDVGEGRRQFSPRQVVEVKGSDGKYHPIHTTQIDRRTLHLMGKNFDGSEDKSLLNPIYWTRAEQFGTLSEKEQKQWERIGVSPYKVAYKPGDDSDLWYEGFKMASFGLADTASQLIPWGLGHVGGLLSTANKVGAVTNNLGKVLNFVGKGMTAETRFGQVLQASAGAAGIAYAYNRGSFLETLEKNLGNAEESFLDRKRKEVYDLYDTDKKYKSKVDALVSSKVAEAKKAYLSQLGGDTRTIDEKALDKELRSNYLKEVLEEESHRKFQEGKGSEEYMLMQDKAIDLAGRTAWATFVPEAVKYGLINTVGFRKWLYSNPTSLASKLHNTATKMSEIATESGKLRLVPKAFKYMTRGDKMKQLGKTALSQAWGGIWTNGSDDMMVDAAEQMNDDAFSQYIQACADGESIADVSGHIDGLYSYWKGLMNSMGQESTLNASIVGGLGSLISASPNMVNIAKVLFSKQGRQEYRDRYMQRTQYETDKNGFKKPKLGEDGKPITEKVSWKDNWRDRLAYFVQNGVLSTYYGNKLEEEDLQKHADYLNRILDDKDDFQGIKDFLASDIAYQNVQNIGDEKTMKFVKAIQLANVLNSLGKDAELSSVTQGVLSMADRLSQIKEDQSNLQELFTEEELNNMLGQYYSNNPGMLQSDYNNWLAINTLRKNAEKLKEATEEYNKAEKNIQKVEEGRGTPIAPAIRHRLKFSLALDKHWDRRLASMKSDIGDNSSTGELSEDLIIPVLGGKENAEALVKTYDRQFKELADEAWVQTKEVKRRETALQEALDKLPSSDNTQAQLDAQKEVENAQVELENAQQQLSYTTELKDLTDTKRERIKNALKNQASNEKGESVSRVLTADEIFSLDPVSRARVMDPLRRSLYSKQQQREIENLENRLLREDGDALQKVQDISLLTQRLATNRDAYGRMVKHPEAAMAQLDAQSMHIAQEAYDILTQRNAELLAKTLNEFDDAMKGHDDVTQADKELFVFQMLRRHNSNLLDIIDKDHLLPQYQSQVYKAKEWSNTMSDITAVVQRANEDDAWKSNVLKSLDAVVENTESKEDIIAAMEKVVDDTDGSPAAADFEKILNGLEELNYQRDSTVLENRQQRRDREAAQKRKQEEEKARIEEARKKALEEAKAALEAEEKNKKEEEEKKEEKKEKNDGQIDSTQDDTDSLLEGATPIDYEDTEGNNSTVKEEKPSSTQENNETSVDNTEVVHDDALGNVIQGKSPTLEEQMKETLNEGHSDAELLTGVKDVYEEAENAERSEDLSEEMQNNTLNGVSMPRHVINKDNENKKNERNGSDVRYEEDLLNDHALVLKKGAKDNDSMNNFFTWLDNHGTKLENIINDEVPQIYASNPHVPIRFMRIRPDKNATHDDYMQGHLFLVVDYDKGVQSIHDESNGGVIKSGGKEYLIIGVVGYGDRSKNPGKFALWKNLMDAYTGHKLKNVAYEWFERPENKSERFYVHPDFHTEFVPGTITSGFLANHSETSPKHRRKLSELLADKSSNPYGLTFENIIFGIETSSGLGTTRSVDRDVMEASDITDNEGRVFVLVPAGNGKYLAVKMDALRYNELDPSTKLGKHIQDLLNQVISPLYEDRLDAISNLCKVLYLSSDKDSSNNILIGQDEHDRRVTVVHGKQRTTFDTSNLDRVAFFEAIKDMNPRINVTMKSLQNLKDIKDLDEAGALRTDALKLGTFGVSYSIFGIDKNGKMTEFNVPKELLLGNYESRGIDKSGSTEFHYLHGEIYSRNSDGRFYLNGVDVSDDPMINYAYYISANRLTPVKQEGAWHYYIINTGNNPEVVRQNNRTNEIKKLENEEAQKVIDEETERLAALKRKAAVEEALREIDKEESKGEDPVFTKEGAIDIDSSEESTNLSDSKSDDAAQPQSPSPASVEGKSTQSTTRTFTRLWRSPDRTKLLEIIKQKTDWSDAPIDSMSKLRKYLEEKGISDLDMIGTSDTAFRAWLHKIECA